MMLLCWRPEETTRSYGMRRRPGLICQLRLQMRIRRGPAGYTTLTVAVAGMKAWAAAKVAGGGLMAPALLVLRRPTQSHLCQRSPPTPPQLWPPLLPQAIIMLRRRRRRKRVRPWSLPRVRIEAMVMLEALTVVWVAQPGWEGSTVAVTTAPLV